MTQDACPQPNGSQRPDYIPISSEQLKQCIVQHAAEIDYALSKGVQIFRGINRYVTYEVRQAGLYTGFACADGNNLLRPGFQADNPIHMYLLSGALENWKNYPPRNKSFCCICDRDIAATWARDGGAVHYVIPLEGQKVGMAPSQDIRYSFQTGLQKYLTQRFDTLYSFTGQILLPLFRQDVEDIKKTDEKAQPENFATVLHDITLNKAKSLMSHTEMDANVLDFLKTFVESNFETMYDFLSAILDPDLNGFQLITKDKYELLQGHSKEVWFTGKVLMIDERFPVAGMKSHKELLEIAN